MPVRFRIIEDHKIYLSGAFFSCYVEMLPLEYLNTGVGFFIYLSKYLFSIMWKRMEVHMTTLNYSEQVSAKNLQNLFLLLCHEGQCKWDFPNRQTLGGAAFWLNIKSCLRATKINSKALKKKALRSNRPFNIGTEYRKTFLCVALVKQVWARGTNEKPNTLLIH